MTVYTVLFRPSRPDFIETMTPDSNMLSILHYCSGLLGRTSLRLKSDVPM